MLLLRKLLTGIGDIIAGRRGFRGGDIAAKDVVAPEVSELSNTVTDEAGDGDVEDGVELLEGLLLGLGQEQQHAEEPHHVPRRVPREPALWRPRRYEGWPCQRDDRVEEPGCCGGERHPCCADVERVRLGAVREGYGLFGGRGVLVGV